MGKEDSAPPDVGEEEAYDALTNSDDGAEDLEEKELPNLDLKTNKNSKSSNSNEVADSKFRLDFERLKGQVDSIGEWTRQIQERLSQISENLGELRTNNVNNEKIISTAIKDSSMAASLVKEMEPDKLRMDYKKLENKISLLDEKIEASKQFTQDILNGFNDLKKKSEAFLGTEGIVKLNDEVKKDLINTKKLASRVELYADKSDEVFKELKSTLSEMQSVNANVMAFNNISEKMKKDIEGIRLDHMKVVNAKEYDDFKNRINKKLALSEQYVGSLDGLKDSNNRLLSLIEKMLRMSKINKDNLDVLAARIGNDFGNNNYEQKLNSILKVVDSLAGEVLTLKKAVGENTRKIEIVETAEELPRIVRLQNVKMSSDHFKQQKSVKPIQIREIESEDNKEIPNVIKKIVPDKSIIKSPSENKNLDGADMDVKMLNDKIAKLSSELGV